MTDDSQSKQLLRRDEHMHSHYFLYHTFDSFYNPLITLKRVAGGCIINLRDVLLNVYSLTARPVLPNFCVLVKILKLMIIFHFFSTKLSSEH